MKYDSELVEYIVREVIRRLTADGRNFAATTSTEAIVKRELTVSDRLVTLATLQGKLDGIKHVIVPRRSVVTPSVRDELNQRMIELKRQ